MNSVPTPDFAPCASRLRMFFWRYPQWWTYALCAAGWWAIARHAILFSHHGIRHSMPFAEELQHWMLMVCAMMLPLIGAPLRETADASVWSRRHRAIASSLLGFLLLWLPVGIPVSAMRGHIFTHCYAAPMIGFAIAAIWQLTPIHAYALAWCHRTPLISGFGWRADADCLLFGCRLGWACVLSCWPMMIACTLTGHSLIAMVACMALGAAERWSFRPRIGTAAVGAALLTGYYAFLSLSLT